MISFVFWTLLLSPGSRATTSERCEVLLARHLMDPPATVALGRDGLFQEVDVGVYARMAAAIRPVSYQIHAHGAGDVGEVTFVLLDQPRGPSHLATLTSLIVRYVDRAITYDQRNGRIGEGPFGATVPRPIGVRVRFHLRDKGSGLWDRQRVFHDEVLPLLKRQVVDLNFEAARRFNRWLLAEPEQTYPAEYDAEPAPDLKPEELGFLIEHLGRAAD